EQHWREEQAAPMQRTVPEALDENETERRTPIMSRDPHPIWIVGHPEAWPPPVPRIPVHPAAGHVRAVLIRRGRGWAFIHRGRSRRYIGQLILIDWTPKAGNPLPTLFHSLPVAGDPLPVRRWNPPEPAHPDEILLSLVPTPVSRDP